MRPCIPSQAQTLSPASESIMKLGVEIAHAGTSPPAFTTQTLSFFRTCATGFMSFPADERFGLTAGTVECRHELGLSRRTGQLVLRPGRALGDDAMRRALRGFGFHCRLLCRLLRLGLHRLQ